MSDGGTITARYILDIQDVELKAAQIKENFAGAAAASNAASLAAQKQAEVTAFVNAELAKKATAEKADAAATEASISAQASLLVVQGRRIEAIELLEGALAQQTTGTAEAVALERQLTQIENQGIAITQRNADATVRLGIQRARAAGASKDYALQLEILNGIETEGASAQTVAALETQIATTERAGTVTGALGGQLSALASPLALVGVGIGVATKAVQSFGEAVGLVGQLQQEGKAFGGIIGDFDKGNAVLAQGTAIGKQYGFTQKEITDAFKNLAPIIRESTSSTQEQTEALARISVLNPSDPVNALTHAIEGIKKGRFTELAGEMGLTKPAAAQLAESVAKGKDAFTALNDALDKQGITLDVARTRMDGLTGATLRQKQAAEDLALAQGNFAAGPGLALLNQQIKITKDATDVFHGSIIGLNNVVRDSAGIFNPLIGAIGAYNNAVLGVIAPTFQSGEAIKASGDLGAGASSGWARYAIAQKAAGDAAAAASPSLGRVKDDLYSAAAAEAAIYAASGRVGGAFEDERHAAAGLNSALEESTAKTLDAQIKTQQLGTVESNLVDIADKVRAGLITSSDGAIILAGKFNLASNEASKLIGLQLQLAGIKDDQTRGGLTGVGKKDADAFGTVVTPLQKQQADAFTKASNDATATQIANNQKVHDAQTQLDLARAKTSGDRIAILQREQGLATDPAEKIRLQTQIEQERNSALKSGTSELNKQLNTQEAIRDSTEKQYKATLDLQKTRAQDVLDRIKEDQEIKTANAILSSANANADFKAAAAAQLSLIDANRKERQLSEDENAATAGGTIGPNGKLFQSIPRAGGGAAPSIPPAAPGVAGQAPAAAPAPGAAGGTAVTFVLVDGAGQIIAKATEPFIMDAIVHGARQVAATVGG